jgi:hypothetical protein
MKSITVHEIDELTAIIVAFSTYVLPQNLIRQNMKCYSCREDLVFAAHGQWRECPSV